MEFIQSFWFPFGIFSMVVASAYVIDFLQSRPPNWPPFSH